MTSPSFENEPCPGCGDGDSVPATGYFICQVCDAEWNGEDLGVPPPVPAEEGGEPDIVVRTLDDDMLTLRALRDISVQVDTKRALSRAIAALSSIPTQAPQDVPGLVEEIARVIRTAMERSGTVAFGDDPEMTPEDNAASFVGYLSAAEYAALPKAILSALRPSPISYSVAEAWDGGLLSTVSQGHPEPAKRKAMVRVEWFGEGSLAKAHRLADALATMATKETDHG